MRYSPDAPLNPEVPITPTEDNRAFFEKAAAKAGVGSIPGAIVLVGGTDHRSLALRRAQTLLRYDRRPSVWSHAALLLEWTGGEQGALGLEVSLDPEVPHVPERNGVSIFRLSRYYDTGRYPNVALITPSFSSEAEAAGARRAILNAALDPNQERPRFPLWDSLAHWARYVYSPETTPNPLLSNVPIPGAAFCEYAYAMAGADLTPGATSDQTCPEVLWATAKRWTRRLADVQGTTLETFIMRRDLDGTAPPSASSLAEDPALASLFAAGKRRPAREPKAGSATRVKSPRRKRRTPR